MSGSAREVGAPEADAEQPAANEDTTGLNEDELEEQLEKETEDVIFGELKKTGPDESQRATLMYLALYEVLHAEARVLQLPDDTLYTAAMVVPMLARSSGYTLSMTAIAIKMVLLTLLCIGLQGGLIVSLDHARSDLPGLDGVPSLCTYGQDTGKSRTPYGPTGQVYQTTYGNVETDYTMIMVRNTLGAVMKKVGVKNGGIGPVEYGMESTTCRVVCAAVFCVAICGEVFSMETMARFLYYSPTLSWRSHSYSSLSEAEENQEQEQGRWIEFEDSARNEKAKEIWPIIGKSSLDHVRFKCNGMPWAWKVCSWLLILLRLGVVLSTFWNGLSFLMNTGGIVDLILNSLALIFIIDLDRLMFSTLSRGVTKEMLHRLEPLHVRPKPGDLQAELNRRRSTELDWGALMFLKRFFFINLSTLVLAAVTIGGHFVYFSIHCKMQYAPFDPTQWMSQSYFNGQTRMFGGWEFVFGSWYSRPTVDKYTHNITCDPAYHSMAGHRKTSPEGCGLPSSWSLGST